MQAARAHLRAERDLYRVSERVQPFDDTLTGVVTKLDEFGCHFCSALVAFHWRADAAWHKMSAIVGASPCAGFDIYQPEVIRRARGGI